MSAASTSPRLNMPSTQTNVGHALLVLNRRASLAKSDDGSIAKAAAQLGIETLDDNDISSHGLADSLRKRIARGADRILIAGGDGSVHRVVNSLAPDLPDVPFTVIPMGTGNDLARSLDAPLDPQLALRQALSWPAKKVDLANVQLEDDDPILLVNAATGGFGAEVTSQTDPETKERWGAAAYWLSAVTHYLNLNEYHLQLECDECRIDERVYGVALGNGRFAGGGFVIAPDSYLNDGSLHIAVMPVLPTLDFVATSLELSVGGQLNSEQLITFTTKSVRLRSDPPMPFSIDGEVKELANVRFESRPQQIRFCHGPRAALL